MEREWDPDADASGAKEGRGERKYRFTARKRNIIPGAFALRQLLSQARRAADNPGGFCLGFLFHLRYPRRRRTRQRREGKMLWCATCSDVGRQRQGGGGLRYAKMMVVWREICVSRRNIVGMWRPSGEYDRLAMPTNFRRCRFFWQAVRARRPLVEALRLKLASLLCGRAAAKIACSCTCKRGLAERKTLIIFRRQLLLYVLSVLFNYLNSTWRKPLQQTWKPAYLKGCTFFLFF